MEQITKVELKALIKEAIREVLQEEIENIEALIQKRNEPYVENDKSIEDIEMSVRLQGILRSRRVYTLSAMKKVTHYDFLCTRNAGERSWKEFLEILAREYTNSD